MSDPVSLLVDSEIVPAFACKAGVCAYCHIRPVTVPFWPNEDTTIGACQTCHDFREELLAGTLGIKRRKHPTKEDIGLVMHRLGVDCELAKKLLGG
jgi:ferredoxin